ncbi:SRPBCC family protein [Sphingobium lignivorans]|uniref:Uncharacterized protein YndB with AHSA1/START domain n=1 Tax=Sphingobium lignivorans TaxID=2735886 RepID=A0ABR6NI99_9SPHN|nr:SRPBCC family protein [Sphingobium lignivorans]MBB5987013.1 uncharacterized protein YndB with AHSA1/START domain [Sphingobium lignivorans]
MFTNAIGVQVRRFEEREHEGAPARVVTLERTYPAGMSDIWDAMTSPERLPRWFLPVSGELRQGGRYQLDGNAGGTITRCDPPRALDISWEFSGATSWVTVRLSPEGEGTLLVLEHIAPVGVMEDHWESFGPAATGTGWDLALMGLGLHLKDGRSVDQEEVERWSASEPGRTFMRESTAAWAEVHVAAGEDRCVAQAMAQRTAAFYMGD